MTREEAKNLLEQWVEIHDASHAACRQFMAPFGADDWDCVAVKHVWKMFDAYTEVLRRILNAPRYESPEFSSDLEWYCLENDMGRKAMDAMGGNITELRPIACIDDLLDLLGDCYESQVKYGVFEKQDGGNQTVDDVITNSQLIDSEREAKILAERMAKHMNRETEVREIFVQVGDVVQKNSESDN